jgi:chemotaxis protein CheZ
MDDIQKKKLLEDAKKLVQSLESDNQGEIDKALDLIVSDSEKTLFNEVGQLTRQLHDSISSFALDGELNNLTDKEIPDAKERLSHVIHITDEAANTTLNALDDMLPLTTQMEKDAEKLSTQWGDFINRDSSDLELKALSSDVLAFIECSKKNASLLHQKSTEIMMAQEFQDLTGQIITKVIGLVKDVETNLVNLVLLSGTNNTSAPKKANKSSSLEGPAVPGIKVDGAVNNQNDVDDLLSSLGF